MKENDNTISIGDNAKKIINMVKEQKGISKKHFASAAIVEKFERDYGDIKDIFFMKENA